MSANRSIHRLASLWVITFWLILLQALAPAHTLAAPKGSTAHRGVQLQRMVCDTLYFGSYRPSGEVTDDQWQQFLKTEITERFPDGLTVYEAYGQWKSREGTLLREHTRVLQIVHRRSSKVDHTIEDLIGTYKRLFGQESVLWVRTSVKAAF